MSNEELVTSVEQVSQKVRDEIEQPLKNRISVLEQNQNVLSQALDKMTRKINDLPEDFAWMRAALQGLVKSPDEEEKKSG